VVARVHVPAERVHPLPLLEGRADVGIGPGREEGPGDVDGLAGRIDGRQVEAGLAVPGLGVGQVPPMSVEEGADGARLPPGAGKEVFLGQGIVQFQCDARDDDDRQKREEGEEETQPERHKLCHF